MLGYLRELSLKRKFGPSIVVVSGLPRSGTSMMMKMLDAAGLQIMTDRVRVADEDNPKGYFEDERVKNLENDQHPTWLIDCRGKVIKIIAFLLAHLPADHHYKVLFMHRNLDEVLASQNKMLVRRGEKGSGSDDGTMKALYRTHLRKIEFLLEEETYFDHIDLHYREVLDHPREQAKRVAKFLRRDLDVDAMAGAVDRSLYRNRAHRQKTPA